VKDASASLAAAWGDLTSPAYCHVPPFFKSASLAAAWGDLTGIGVNSRKIPDCRATLKTSKHKGVLSLECEDQAGPMIARSLEWTRQAL